ncbi:MAG: ATP-binding protein [Streptomyces sp.]|nr:ATP-binding protein [Streptomyces sp.]NUT27912.1 ATP-binding protein [Streptomyces sp.]
MYCSEPPHHPHVVDASPAWYLPAHEASAGVARRHVRSFVMGKRCTALADDCVLIASELVTNAVEHGAGPVWLAMSHVLLGDGGEAVHLLVGDHGPGRGAALPPLWPRPDDGMGTSGRGLNIVDALATAWGSARIAAGHIVWADLHNAPRPQATCGPQGHRHQRPRHRIT